MGGFQTMQSILLPVEQGGVGTDHATIIFEVDFFSCLDWSPQLLFQTTVIRLGTASIKRWFFVIVKNDLFQNINSITFGKFYINLSCLNFYFQWKELILPLRALPVISYQSEQKNPEFLGQRFIGLKLALPQRHLDDI